MTRRRISESLMLEDDAICCSACAHAIGKAGRGWKAHAVLRRVKLIDLPCAGFGVSSKAVMRQFFCPSCATLLDTETALPDDPFLEDIVVP